MRRAAALALLLASCASGRKDKGEPRADAVNVTTHADGAGGAGARPRADAGAPGAADAATATVPPQPEKTDMMATLKSACEVVSRPTLTVAEAAAALGSVERDLGGRLQVVVKPRDPAFAKAQVMRQPQGDTPAGIELELADAQALTVAALRAALGPYSEPPRVHFDSPHRIIFKARPGCAVVAVVVPGAGGVADGLVPRLTLRRDVP